MIGFLFKIKKKQTKYFIAFFLKELFLLVDEHDFPFYLNRKKRNSFKVIEEKFSLQILCCPRIDNLKNNS